MTCLGTLQLEFGIDSLTGDKGSECQGVSRRSIKSFRKEGKGGVKGLVLMKPHNWPSWGSLWRTSKVVGCVETKEHSKRVDQSLTFWKGG